MGWSGAEIPADLQVHFIYNVGLGGDGFPGRVGAGTPGILPRGGETGRGICGASGRVPRP